MTSTHTFPATARMPLPVHPDRRVRTFATPGAAVRIVLTGFMGSGKSTTGRLLAAELGWTFVDLDDVIERRTGLTVPQIFAERGEEAFRREETAALVEVLRATRSVVALGGGAPETLSNRLLLEQTPATAVVFLAAPFDTLRDRCARQAEDARLPARPLFSDPVSAEARFTARQPIYARLAHLTVETHGKSPEQTVGEVVAAVAANATH